jgi:hypothetical protein
MQPRARMHKYIAGMGVPYAWNHANSYDRHRILLGQENRNIT